MVAPIGKKAMIVLQTVCSFNRPVGSWEVWIFSIGVGGVASAETELTRLMHHGYIERSKDDLYHATDLGRAAVKSVSVNR